MMKCLAVLLSLTIVLGTSVGVEMCQHDSGHTHFYIGLPCNANHSTNCSDGHEHSHHDLEDHDHCSHDVLPFDGLAELAIHRDSIDIPQIDYVVFNTTDVFICGSEAFHCFSNDPPPLPPKVFSNNSLQFFSACVCMLI